jgi:hypothetical protein
MIVVTVELWPHGESEGKELLGVARIVNIGTGTPARGNYIFQLYRKKKVAWFTGYVHDFPRQQLSVWDLVYRILDKTIASRNRRPKEI